MKNFLLFILFTNLIFSQQKENFVSANEKYNSGDFVSAIQKYNEIIINGDHSPEVYFNLGNAYYKLDSLALGIYYYEIGLKYFPNDFNLSQNLEYLNHLTIDDIEALPFNIVSKKTDYIFNYFSLHTWSLLCIALGVTSSFLFLFYSLSNSTRIKRITFTLFVLSYILTSCLLFISFKKYNIQNNFQYAIVFDETVEVNLEPNNNSEVLFELHEGTKIEILEDFDEDWIKIKLADGQIGWVIKNQIKVI
jgi:tetratricopeptide (TPR) repeat protein